jgi:hypothetical protein
MQYLPNWQTGNPSNPSDFPLPPAAVNTTNDFVMFKPANQEDSRQQLRKKL